jgi:hypothetical protein
VLGYTEAMTRRLFKRYGNNVADSYAANDSGESLEFVGPVAMFASLGWDRLDEPWKDEPFDGASQQREREHVRALLREGALEALDTEHFLLLERLGDHEAATFLGRRFGELVAAWTASDPVKLAHAASALLSSDRGHTGAATTLASLLVTDGLSHVDRSRIAQTVAGAVDVNGRTEAASILRDALRRLIRARDGIVWGPFAYTCVRPLYALDKTATLARCEAELRERGEWERHLLLNELAEVPGSEISVMLLRHFESERSPRLKSQLVRLLGELLPEAQRVEALAAGLQDESPWGRYLALKSLRRVPPPAAHDLATANLEAEPEELLRGLLEQVIAATRSALVHLGPR